MQYFMLLIFSMCLSQINFDSSKAFDLVLEQCSFGPRYPGSDGHEKCKNFIVDNLSQYNDDIIIDEHKIKDPLTSDSVNIYNVFYRYNPDREKRILLMAHWDTRKYADKDPDPLNHDKPVMGANDGASGVAVLLVVLEQLNKNNLSKIGVDFLFADAEDMGVYGQPDTWAIGSKLFSQKYPSKLPQFGICVDMVADKDLNIKIEKYSYQMAPGLINDIWGIAKRNGYSNIFKNQIGPGIIDDHISFSMSTNIPSIDIIDLDYIHWHTIQDVPENISKNSLGVVGDVLIDFIYKYDNDVK